MTDIKTGLWQNNLDGSYIKVKNVLETYITYSDEGCAGTHVMNKREIIGCYKLVEADEPSPITDDTFNDDTPAQTFGDIQWDEGRGEKTVKVAVCLTCGAKMPEGSLAFEALNRGLGCPTCNANAGKKIYGPIKLRTSEWCMGPYEEKVSTPMRLIGIAGPARAGKDTLCSYMLDNLDGIWLRSSFADPLKEMLRAIGVDCSDDAKAVISDDYGVTPRHMMQTLGTEWGRQTIDGDIWVKAFARLNAGKCVIVPDVRFENEAELVREHGVLIHLVGRGGIDGNHVSENAIAFKLGDIVIDNSRDMAWLMSQVDGNAVLSDFISEVSE